MMTVYCYCSPPVISLIRLRTYLNKALEAGPAFDGALFSILERIEKTRGDTFTTFSEPGQHTFRSP